MKVIYKYLLPVRDIQRVQMPEGAEILAVQEQNGAACLWAIVEDTNTLVYRNFETFGTGQPIMEDMDVMREYIGTYQLNRGGLVFHIFERK